MKIAVYAIALNENKFVERFCNSAKDADLILIADTGSTDGTQVTARQHGATVIQINIKPWRFDKARDASLALLPADIDVCICLDLDEVLEYGWREEIERVWTDGATRMRYMFDWSNGIKFYSDKIHSRHGYFWKHPCHETLTKEYRTQEKWVQTDKLLVSHYPDETKSRSQYMPLLELAKHEDPHCERNAFYFARELVFTRQWDRAITALKEYLDMPKASWDYERSYAMRLLGQAYEAIGDNFNAYVWLMRACAEAPNTREGWLDLANYSYRYGNWSECYSAIKKCLSITERQFVYTSDPKAWSELPYDLGAFAAYKLGLLDDARLYSKIAFEHNPSDERLANNFKIFEATGNYDGMANFN